MATIQIELFTDDPDQVAALRAYWDLAEDGQWAATVTAVRQQFGLTNREMQRIVQEAGQASVPEVTCPDCGTPWEVTSRSHYSDLIRRGNTACAACQAVAHQARLAAARELDVRQRAALKEAFPVYSDAEVEVDQLTLAQAVMLHALFSDPAVEDQGLTTPTDIWPKELPWAPSSLRYDYERSLLHARPPVILAHPNSHVSAFVWKDGEPDGTFYLGRVNYYLLGPEDNLPDRAPRLIDDLNRTFREGPWPEAWLQQWRDLWNELTLAYAATYLDMKLGEHHLEMKQGDGTKTALADALATFSLGQVFNFIYRAAKDSAAYYQRGGVNKRQAANSTVGRISASADRARANGWEIKSFGMPWNLPLSAVGQVFFDKVMWVPDMMGVPANTAHPPPHAWICDSALSDPDVEG